MISDVPIGERDCFSWASHCFGLGGLALCRPPAERSRHVCGSHSSQPAMFPTSGDSYFPTQGGESQPFVPQPPAFSYAPPPAPPSGRLISIVTNPHSWADQTYLWSHALVLQQFTLHLRCMIALGGAWLSLHLFTDQGVTDECDVVAESYANGEYLGVVRGRMKGGALLGLTRSAYPLARVPQGYPLQLAANVWVTPIPAQPQLETQMSPHLAIRPPLDQSFGRSIELERPVPAAPPEIAESPVTDPSHVPEPSFALQHLDSAETLFPDDSISNAGSDSEGKKGDLRLASKEGEPAEEPGPARGSTKSGRGRPRRTEKAPAEAPVRTAAADGKKGRGQETAAESKTAAGEGRPLRRSARR